MHYLNNTRTIQHIHIESQKGFTLPEMMIALTLGLLVAAAAVQVFYISQRTATTQSSASDIQDSSVFGIQRLEQELRFVNLGAETSKLSGDTRQGGIIITQRNATDIKDATYLTDADLFTRQNAHASSFGNSGDLQSDQLTVQFETPQDMLDCQGTLVTSGTQLIQRYFLQKNGSNLALVCDANTTTNPASSVIIPNVDQFKVLFLTNNGYRSPDVYIKSGATDSIHGLKLGLVVAGGTPTIETGSKKISIFGKDYTLPTDSINTVRRVYEPTIMFRNARL